MPVILPIAFGYSFRLFKVFDEIDIAVLRKFVIQVSVPFLIFNNLYKADVKDIEQVFPSALSFFILTGLFTLLPYLFIKIINKGKIFNAETINTYLIATFIGNYAFLGWGIVHSFYGDRGFTRAVFFTMFFWVVFLFWGFLILYLRNRNNSSHGKRFFLKIIFKKAFFPLLAALSGIGLNLIDLALPKFLMTFVGSFAALTIPMILFTIGLNFNIKLRLSQLKIAVLSSFSRLIFGFALGFITVFFIKIILHIDNLTVKVVLIESVMPTATMSVFFTDFIKIDKEMLSGIITLSTIMALITIPIWYIVIEKVI